MRLKRLRRSRARKHRFEKMFTTTWPVSYYAKFENIDGHQFRFDTRIYLDFCAHPEPDGVCVAAVVGKNPGSARTTSIGHWGPLMLDGDKLLPSIRNRFLTAYAAAKKSVPSAAYVRVWNLFYLCDADLNNACEKLKNCVNPGHCKSEAVEAPPILWAVWGGPDDRLDKMKERFSQRVVLNSFFFCNTTQQVAKRMATKSDFARHTQGLPAEPIIEHLAARIQSTDRTQRKSAEEHSANS